MLIIFFLILVLGTIHYKWKEISFWISSGLYCSALMLGTSQEPEYVLTANTNSLSDEYQYIMIVTQQLLGDTDPAVAMYQLVPYQTIKASVIAKLADINRKFQVVWCWFSLLMGMNLSGFEYVIHYRIPPTAATTTMFFHETGRMSREV